LYTTSTCPECERAAHVLDALGIPYVKKAIDLDPEAQTDALMLRITKVPAVAVGEQVLRVPVNQLRWGAASTSSPLRSSCVLQRQGNTHCSI
jgi:glutaredoxin